MRIVFCTDSLHPPEVLPGIELYDTSICGLRFSNKLTAVASLFAVPPFVKNRKNELPPGWDLIPVGIYLVVTIPKALMTVAVFPMWYLPSLFYRLSIKATSVVYLPVLFAVKSHLGESLSGSEYCDDIRHGNFEAITRYYSWAIVLLSVASLAVTVAPMEVVYAAARNGGPAWRSLLDLFIPTDGFRLTIKGWHIARLANAVIAIGVFSYADRALRRLMRGSWDEGDVKRRIETARAWQLFLEAAKKPKNETRSPRA